MYVNAYANSYSYLYFAERSFLDAGYAEAKAALVEAR